MKNQELLSIQALGQSFFGQSAQVEPLQGDGSDRQIYRLTTASGRRAVGVVHHDIAENEDFFLVTEAMSRLHIPVPQVYLVNPSRDSYLLEDLGEHNLATDIIRWNQAGKSEPVLRAYKKAISWLPRMQKGLAKLLSSHLSVRQMDEAQLNADLDYFTEYFVDLMGQAEGYGLEVSAELSRKLLKPIAALERDCFVYRDFQARNLMWCEDKVVFLDYQSAMLGNRFYDLASLLYGSKAGLSKAQRSVLFEFGYQQLKQPGESRKAFEQSFYLVLLLRRLRSLGSYGYLGKIKGKAGFLASLPPAIRQIKLISETQLDDFKELNRYFKSLDLSQLDQV